MENISKMMETYGNQNFETWRIRVYTVHDGHWMVLAIIVGGSNNEMKTLWWLAMF